MTLIFLYLNRKTDKKRFVTYANYYTVFKTIFNSILVMSIVSLVLSRYEVSDIMMLLVFSLIYYPCTIVEIYIIVRKVNRYRKVSASPWLFFRNWNMGIIINTAAIWLIILLYKKVKPEIFLVAMYFFALIFPWIQMYILGLDEQGNETDSYREMLQKKYGITCDKKMYVFNGKLNKNPNIYVKGIFWKKRIMISDYLIENFSEDEMCALLCHEIAHCINCDSEAVAILLNFITLVLMILGYLLQNISMPPVAGIVLVVATVMVLLSGVLKIRRGQEYRADRYCVDITGEYKFLVNALVKQYEYGDVMENKGKLLALFATHPQLNLRIQQIKKYYDQREKI